MALRENNEQMLGSFHKMKEFFSNYYIYLSFIIIIIISSILTPVFLNPANIINVLLQNSVITILSIGQLFVIVTGGIDLSVGSIVALSASLVAGFLNFGLSPVLAVFIVLILMAIIGGITGGLIFYGKAAPFIVTFSMMTIIRGMAYIYQTGSDLRIHDEAFINGIIGQIKGFPLPIIYMVFIAVMMSFILRKTVFGRTINAIGGSEKTCISAGIKVNYFTIAVYSVSGIMAGFGGIILAARLGMGTALIGIGYELDAIASVLIGGAALTGGSGVVINTIIGAFIIGILNNILNLLGIPTYPQMILKGLIVLIAVLANRRG